MPGLLTDTVFAVSLGVSPGTKVSKPARPKLVENAERNFRLGVMS